MGVRLLIVVLVALAASGTYALLSFGITECAHEISIRAAMGAPAHALLRTVGRRAMAQLAAGASIGTAGLCVLYVQIVGDGWHPPASPALIARCCVERRRPESPCSWHSPW